MEKIKLTDGTVIEIESGCTEYEVAMISESVDEIVAHFTDSNLERYEILTESGDVCAIYQKKHMKKASAVLADNGYLVTIYLTDIDETAKRLTSLENTVNTLLGGVE